LLERSSFPKATPGARVVKAPPLLLRLAVRGLWVAVESAPPSSLPVKAPVAVGVATVPRDPPLVSNEGVGKSAVAAPPGQSVVTDATCEVGILYALVLDPLDPWVGEST